jgi:excinuclease ABC subunit C
LKAAQKALSELEIKDIPIISLAKKEEIIFSQHHKQGLKLDDTSPALKLIQNIRDEAHRFALSSHRRRRQKASFRSFLDNIPGIGPKRKAALLSHFNSVDSIKNASLVDLQKITGKKAAEKLLNLLKKEKI